MMAMVKTKFQMSGYSPSFGSPGGNVLIDSKKGWYRKEKLETMLFGTWNVRTLAQPGKLQNTIQEMKRLKLQILGISEMRWPSAGVNNNEEDYTVYYSGTLNNTFQHGVGFIVHKQVVKCVTNFVPISERIAFLQINARPVNINLIQIYAPTTDYSNEDVDQFYKQISDIIKPLPQHDINIIMGDFNAKLGKGRTGEHIGDFGLGERNERGDTLSAFAAEHDLIVTNTFFQHHPRRLYTWKSNDGKTRNQIDFVLINKRFRNCIKNIKTYPGADVRSDHNPLIGKMGIRLKRVEKKHVGKYDFRRLKDTATSKLVKRELLTETEERENDGDVEEYLKVLRESIHKVKEKYLKPSKQMKKSWMTDDILELMERRRLFKNKTREYMNIQREIRAKIRTAKEREKLEKCVEIEECQAKFDSFNLHKKVKEMAGTVKRRAVNVLKDNQGRVIVKKSEIKQTWEEYIKQLFDDVRTVPPNIDNTNGPPILEGEVQAALKNAKEQKALGPDGIPAEILKLIEGKNLRRLTKVFNVIYDTGVIPTEWLKSEFVTLPKKPNASKCNEFRTISLMSHLLKIFLKIIHSRIFKLCEEQISDTQFGFRSAVGTREALFSIQVLFQRCRDVNCDVYACFIDYKKAFDQVRHTKMMEVLQKAGLDGKDLKIIRNLYWNQRACVSVDRETTEEIQILRGVRQGCILSPVIFNLYSEYIFREALQDIEAGILLNGERLNNIRYADDTVIFADNLASLQLLMDSVTSYSRQYGLEINTKKTKFMIISKDQNTRGNLLVDGTPLEKVNKYTYLGTNINDNWDHSVEIRTRIEKARTAFIRMKKVFTSHDLQLTTKIRLLRCYVFSTLFYGVESWTLTEASSIKLEAFEMWLYRRIQRIPWTERITNTEVLRRMGKEKEVLNTVKTRKLQYLGHIMRNESRYVLLQKILQGKVYGARGVGRRRISWLKNLRTWFNQSTTQLFRAAVNKVRIANMIANIRNG